MKTAWVYVLLSLLSIVACNVASETSRGMALLVPEAPASQVTLPPRNEPHGHLRVRHASNAAAVPAATRSAATLSAHLDAYVYFHKNWKQSTAVPPKAGSTMCAE